MSICSPVTPFRMCFVSDDWMTPGQRGECGISVGCVNARSIGNKTATLCCVCHYRDLALVLWVETSHATSLLVY